jgi:hypothetical protein
VADHEEGRKAREIERAEKKLVRSSRRRESLPRTRACFALGWRRSVARRHLCDKAPEKPVEAIDRLEVKIKTFKLQVVDRKSGIDVTWFPCYATPLSACRRRDPISP